MSLPALTGDTFSSAFILALLGQFHSFCTLHFVRQIKDDENEVREV